MHPAIVSARMHLMESKSKSNFVSGSKELGKTLQSTKTQQKRRSK
jgi:hypothetical protein